MTYDKDTMPKLFSLYCAVLIILLGIANYQGIIYSTYLFTEDSEAAKSANQYHK